MIIRSNIGNKTRNHSVNQTGQNMRRLCSKLYTLTYFPSLIPLKVYDIVHKTRFSGTDPDGDKDGRFAYFPSSVFSFPSLGRYIRRNMQNGRGHSVLDIGCGKGFVLLFFSRLHFDQVSGIEYDQALCRLAAKNLKRTRSTVSIYHSDATDFPGYGNYDTFYLYNPFDKAIMEQCLDRILSSLQQHPRKLTVFYCNPVHGDLLKEKGFQEVKHFYYKTTIYHYGTDILKKTCRRNQQLTKHSRKEEPTTDKTLPERGISN